MRQRKEWWFRKCVVAIGSNNSELTKELAQELEHLVNSAFISCADTPARLRELTSREKPEVILLEDSIFNGAPLAESLAGFAAIAPVILIAFYHRHSEVARLVAAGQMDFVPRASEAARLAASLIERRLRWAEEPGGPVAVKPNLLGEDIGEFFRHEINNPLTGILGNAELLLAHSDRFPAPETQRIRTVVELAVRLRETVRRVTNAWEMQPRI